MSVISAGLSEIQGFGVRVWSVFEINLGFNTVIEAKKETPSRLEGVGRGVMLTVLCLRTTPTGIRNLLNVPRFSA
jgi:hypothetical protein